MFRSGFRFFYPLHVMIWNFSEECRLNLSTLGRILSTFFVANEGSKLEVDTGSALLKKGTRPTETNR